MHLYKKYILPMSYIIMFYGMGLTFMMYHTEKKVVDSLPQHCTSHRDLTTRWHPTAVHTTRQDITLTDNISTQQHTTTAGERKIRLMVPSASYPVLPSLSVPQRPRAGVGPLFSPEMSGPWPAQFFHGSGNWINDATVQLLLTCSFFFN